MTEAPPPPPDRAGWRRRGVLGLIQSFLVLPWLAPSAASQPIPGPPMPRPPGSGSHVFEPGVFEPGVFE